MKIKKKHTSVLLLLLLLQWQASGYKVEVKGNTSKAIARILEGTRVLQKDYPHVVEFFNDQVLCGANIITSRAILTAAHCLDLNRDPQYMIIIFSAREKTFNLNKNVAAIWDFAINDEYYPNIITHDIALVFLEKPLKLNKFAQRAFLVDSDGFEHTPKGKFIVTGWGMTSFPKGGISHNGLQMIALKYVPKDYCEQIYGTSLAPDVICLYGGEGRDTCEGDSGSGVLWSNMLTAIVGCGFECGSVNVPGLYISVYYHMSWIENSINKYHKKLCAQKLGR